MLTSESKINDVVVVSIKKIVLFDWLELKIKEGKEQGGGNMKNKLVAGKPPK